MESNLKKKTINGLKWSFIDRILGQGISFVLLVVIARLVSPADYGLLAIVMVFVNISNTFIDCGFSNALIRNSCKNDVDNSTVFYFNIIASSIIYVILFFLSGVMADFYNKPVLEILIKYASVVVIINSLALVQQSILTSRIDFKTQTVVSFVSALISGTTGIALAYNGYGVWALIVQTVTLSIIKTCLLWIVVRWKPLWVFSESSFRNLFGYSVRIMFSNLLANISTEINNLVIGRNYQPSQLGYYSYANKMSGFPSSVLVSIVRAVMFPALSQVKDDDTAVTNNFKTSLHLSYFVISPIMLCLAALAAPFITILLSDKWLPSADLLQILAISLSVWPLVIMYKNIMYVKGYSNYDVRIQFIITLLKLCAVLIFSHYSIIVFCWAYCIICMVETLVFGYATTLVMDYKLIDQLKDIHRTSLFSITSYLLVAFCVVPLFDNSMLQLFIGGFSFFISYIFLAYIFERSELKMIFQTLKTLFVNA